MTLFPILPLGTEQNTKHKHNSELFCFKVLTTQFFFSNHPISTTQHLHPTNTSIIPLVRNQLTLAPLTRPLKSRLSTCYSASGPLFHSFSCLISHTHGYLLNGIELLTLTVISVSNVMFQANTNSILTLSKWAAAPALRFFLFFKIKE